MSKLRGDALRQQAIALINQRPGMSQDQLCTALGFRVRVSVFKKGTERAARNPRILQLIRELAEKNLIRAEKEQFATQCEPLKLYPIDYQPKEKRLFQHVKQPECKVYYDPDIIANPTLLKPEMAKQRDRDQIREALQDSLKILVDQGKPFTIEQWVAKAETVVSVLYKPAYADIRAEGQEAIARLKRTTVDGSNALDAHLSKVAPNANSTSHLPAAKKQTEAQSDEVTALRKRIQELEGQLSRSLDKEAIALEVLRSDEQELKAQLQRIDEDTARLEEERKRIITHLHGVQQAISLRTNEPVQPEFVMVVNGNGKVAV